MYPRTRLQLPPLSPEQASLLVDLLDATIAALWETHGDAIVHLLSLPNRDSNDPDDFDDDRTLDLPW